MRIFDGVGPDLSEPSHVLVIGFVIKRISTMAITPPEGLDLVIIDGAGRTLTPGLIDAHTMMLGGGVSSAYDPLDVTQYTVPELRAGVEAADNWGTYATVHA